MLVLSKIIKEISTMPANNLIKSYLLQYFLITNTAFKPRLLNNRI